MVGAQVLKPISCRIMLGGQFGLYHWSDKHKNVLMVVEAYPTVRIHNIVPDIGFAAIFFQTGLGAIYIPKWAFGFNAGIGFTTANIGRIKFELLPTYHYGIVGDESNSFFSVNIGVFVEN